MRDATELPADLLEGRLAPSHEPEDSSSTATRIARVAQLADRGEHAAAAREAAELIDAGIYDVRVIGFYLFGVFLQRGIGYLPALLGRVSTLVGEELAVLRPSRRKLQVVSSATAWLFEHVSTRLLFHTKQRDATWEAWRGASDGPLADAIAAGCTTVTLALEAAIDAPLAASPLARIRRWTNEDLRRAVARREAAIERVPVVARADAAVVRGPDREPSTGSAPGASTGQREVGTGSAAPQVDAGQRAAELPEDPLQIDEGAEEPADEPLGDQAGLSHDEAGPSDDEAGLSDDEAGPSDEAPDGSPDLLGDPPAAPAAYPARAGGPRRAGAPRPARSPDDAMAVGSPALAALQAKLRGFQALVARGELAKAAVVVSDVRAVLANFDPVAFFPSMFVAYFKALHQIINELAPYLDGVDLPSWHALDSYYRADMRGFFED